MLEAAQAIGAWPAIGLVRRQKVTIMDAPSSSRRSPAVKTLEQRRQLGVEWRQRVPLATQGAWNRAAHRRDPVEILTDQGKNRIEELLPVRYARMKSDAFAFLRGAAAIMAADLAALPATGLRVQSCGDCHLANFGAYPSPEGTPVFDINDFDETLPAPFEWDVKRLATSLAVAGRAAHMPEGDCRHLARLAGSLAGL
jgi:Uncharacterized protein conserved in bacteria (DUF2252)